MLLFKNYRVLKDAKARKSCHRYHCERVATHYVFEQFKNGNYRSLSVYCEADAADWELTSKEMRARGTWPKYIKRTRHYIENGLACMTPIERRA